MSTPRFSRERSVQARKRVERVGVGRVRVGAAAHLRRDGQAASPRSAQEPADEPLGAPVAVDVGGVEERHARVDGRPQHLERVVLGDRAPVGRRAASTPRPTTPTCLPVRPRMRCSMSTPSEGW